VLEKRTKKELLQ